MTATTATALTREQLHALARRLAGAMPGWTYQSPKPDGPDRYATLAGPDGQALDLSGPSHPASLRGRLRVAGDFGDCLRFASRYLRREDGGYQECSITVSAARPVREIAAEIATRLLPVYWRVHAAARESQRIRNAGHQRAAATLATLSAIVEPLAARCGHYQRAADSDDEHRAYFYLLPVGDGADAPHPRGDIEVSAFGPRIDLRLDDLSEAQAIAVLAALTTC